MKDQTPPTTQTQSTTAETTPSDNTVDTAQPAPKSPSAPESYTAFSAPEGVTLDPALVERATPVFRELGLDQAGAQKLVDFVSKLEVDRGKVHEQLVTDMRSGWRTEFAQDPEMGSKTEQITTDIGRFKDLVFGPAGSGNKERLAFEHGMNLTGSGDHPGVIRGIWKMAQQVLSAAHVSGGGPSKHGQTPPGAPERPSAAQAMYPNLPH